MRVLRSTVDHEDPGIDEGLRDKIVDHVRAKGDHLARIGDSRDQWEIYVAIAQVRIWGVESWVILEESQSELHAEWCGDWANAFAKATEWIRTIEECWDEGCEGWDLLDEEVRP